jgi:hypothetical protein
MIFQWLALALLSASQISAQTIDLRTNARVTHAWLETGFVNVNDANWVTVNSIGNEYVDPVVLISLPDVGGDLYTTGLPTATRIRNFVNNVGQVTFEVKLFQPNDSYCLKTWFVPQYISPDVEIGWSVAEYGAYNVSSQYMFVIGRGIANRTSPTLGTAFAYEFHQLDYPTGCGPYSNLTCAFPQSYPREELGALATFQSFIHQEFLLLRIQTLIRRYLKIVVTPHDAADPAYYARFKEPETIGFMVFRTGITLDCVERMTFETKRWDTVTSRKLYFPFAFNYLATPGVFGIIVTQNSLVDATALRVFARTTSEAYIITQEDYCDEADPIHTTNESASVLVVGETLLGQALCDVIYSAPTAAPTSFPTFSPTESPTNGPACTYNFLLYDLFGDGWQNIELAVDTDGAVTNYKVQCACDMIQIVSQSCVLTVNMISNGEAIAPWEPIWASKIGGVTWVGDFNTTMWIDHDSVTVKNGPDVDPNSLGNQCKACTAPDDDDKDGGDKKGPGRRNRRGDGRGKGRGAGNDDGKGAGNDDGKGIGAGKGNDDGKGNGAGKGNDDGKGNGAGKGNDDGKGNGAGKGNDDGKGNGAGKGNDDGKGSAGNSTDDGKKRNLGAGDDGIHGNGMARFTIFDQFGNGWYNGTGFSSGACDSELCPNNDDTCVEDTIDLPEILTYPKWYVMNAARTELVDFGSMCENPKGIEGCAIALPDGRYVFRVAGYSTEGDLASWRFCGVYGVNHQELQFQMVNGQCVPNALLAAEDYCTGFKTLVSLSGSIGISGVTDANLDDYDTNAIYLQLLAMFPNTVAVEIISQSLDSGVLTVNFVVTVSPEDYGLDGSVSNNIDTCLNSVYAAAQTESQSSFLTGLSTTILSSPTGAKDPLAHVSGATLTSLEVIQVQYVKKDDNTVLHPLDVTASSSTQGEVAHNGVSLMTIAALVCGAIFMAAATAYGLMRSRTSTHSPLSDKSSHLDSSVNKVSSGTSLDIEK